MPMTRKLAVVTIDLATVNGKLTANNLAQKLQAIGLPGLATNILTKTQRGHRLVTAISLHLNDQQMHDLANLLDQPAIVRPQ